jgi:hypothetical protein
VKSRKGRKKEEGAKKGDDIQTAELDRRDQVTATKSWPGFLRKGGTEVDYQVAAPTESSTPTLHRATIAQQRVRMEGWRQRRLGSMGTIWKKKNKEEQRRRKKKWEK